MELSYFGKHQPEYKSLILIMPILPVFIVTSYLIIKKNNYT